jgi:hypothetical protein
MSESLQNSVKTLDALMNELIVKLNRMNDHINVLDQK